jgi:threonyl-tRNA synthetase
MKVVYLGKEVEIEDGANGFDAAKVLDAANKNKDVAVKVGADLRYARAASKPAENSAFVNEDSPEAFELLNHSTSHLMAQAIIHLYPKAKFGFGPAIEEGYYYDVDFGDQVITEADFAKIEEEMKKLAKENIPFVRKEVSAAEARRSSRTIRISKSSSKSIENELISIYEQGDFTDFCRGPHVPSTGYIKHFKLLERRRRLLAWRFGE